MKSLKIFSVILILLSVITGCKLSNPSIMLRTPKGFVYDKFPSVPDSQYIIAKDDIVGFRLMANDGIGLVEIMGAERGNAGDGQKTNQEFTVEFDGTIKLPVLGRFKISGLTERQAEDSLEKLFSALYKKPFVQLKVLNRRVTVFPGGMGTAKVIPLVNQNITLFEALALSGGIDPDGKAYRIKLIRGSLKRPYVFLIDASNIETIQEADLVLQADDIIYVEPLERPIRIFTRDVAPWIGLVTSTAGLAVTIYTLTRIYK
jgi:polysaccharide export outer membrane protein